VWNLSDMSFNPLRVAVEKTSSNWHQTPADQLTAVWLLPAYSMQVIPAMTSVHNLSARIRRTNPRVQVVAQEAVSSGETWNTGASWCPHWPTYPGLIMWLAFKFWMPSDSAIIVTPWILSNPKSQVQEVQWRFVPFPGMAEWHLSKQDPCKLQVWAL